MTVEEADLCHSYSHDCYAPLRTWGASPDLSTVVVAVGSKTVPELLSSASVPVVVGAVPHLADY